MEHPVRFILLMLLLLFYLVAVIRFVWPFIAPLKKVPAQIVRKKRWERDAPREPGGKVYRYAVTFQTEQKCKSFYVTELFFQSHQEEERGTLTYRSNRLIDFH